MAYPYEFFNSIEDCQKPVDILKKQDFFSKTKNDYLDDEEIERTNEIIKLFNIKNREELTEYIWKVMYFCLLVCSKKF